jgi:ribonuclease P protein component
MLVKRLKWAFQSQKKLQKKAVDRITSSAALRETYRLNKHLLSIKQSHTFMFFYQTKDRLSFEEINTKTIQLFEKFIAQNTHNTETEIKIQQQKNKTRFLVNRD